MISVKELVKVAARSAYYVMSRAAGFAALGMSLNLLLVPLLWPEISRFIHLFLPNLPHAGGEAAVIALAIMAIYALPGILLAGIFLVGFPIAYFILGKKHGVTLALTVYLRDKKEELLLYLLERLFAAIRERPAWMKQVEELGPVAALRKLLPQYSQRFANMPRPMRWLLHYALSQVRLDSVLDALLEGGLESLEVERLSKEGIRRASALLDDRLFTPSLRPLALLVVANLATFALVKILV